MLSNSCFATAKSHFGNQPEYMNVRIVSLLAVQLLGDTLASRGKELLTVLTSAFAELFQVSDSLFELLKVLE